MPPPFSAPSESDAEVPDGAQTDGDALRPAGAGAADAPSAPDALPGDGERRRLSARAVPYWRVRIALIAVPVTVAVTLLAVLVHPWPAVRTVAAIVAWVAAVGAVAVVPPLRARGWWYAIGEEQVDLHEGLIVVTRTVVPMVRVQHVDLHRGPISTRLGLAEIELHTAAGSVSIPALDRDEAERIRRRVAVLARVPDEL